MAGFVGGGHWGVKLAAAVLVAMCAATTGANECLTLDRVDELVGEFAAGKGLNATYAQPVRRSPCWHGRSGKKECLPGMLIIGTPKSGTTDLAARLKLHPLLTSSRTKEPHFWARCGKYSTSKTFRCPRVRVNDTTCSNWPALAKHSLRDRFNHYLKEWDAAAVYRSGAIAFEASASTFWDGLYQAGTDTPTPALLRKAYGTFAHKLKLIVLVREPVARAWSDFKYFQGRKKRHDLKVAHGKPRAFFHDAVVASVASCNACFKERGVLACITDKAIHQAVRDSGRMTLGIYEPYLNVWSRYFGRVRVVYQRISRVLLALL